MRDVTFLLYFVLWNLKVVQGLGNGQSNSGVPRFDREYHSLKKANHPSWSLPKHFVNSPVLRKVILQFSSSQRVTTAIYFT